MMPTFSFPLLLAATAAGVLIYSAVTGKNPTFVVKEALNTSGGTGKGTGGTKGVAGTDGKAEPAAPPAAQWNNKR